MALRLDRELMHEGVHEVVEELPWTAGAGEVARAVPALGPVGLARGHVQGVAPVGEARRGSRQKVPERAVLRRPGRRHEPDDLPLKARGDAEPAADHAGADERRDPRPGEEPEPVAWPRVRVQLLAGADEQAHQRPEDALVLPQVAPPVLLRGATLALHVGFIGAGNLGWRVRGIRVGIVLPVDDTDLLIIGPFLRPAFRPLVILQHHAPAHGAHHLADGGLDGQREGCFALHRCGQGARPPDALARAAPLREVAAEGGVGVALLPEEPLDREGRPHTAGPAPGLANGRRGRQRGHREGVRQRLGDHRVRGVRHPLRPASSDLGPFDCSGSGV
uniref:Uncharacterized protein n=1 Tax=Tetraselmis sp. GSL018 TaxID=582737 RepID=A0A061RTR0_9CHLO|mmetsp:Transcript_10065/g.24006  ORF Transcript_10065/g.24006 Transcript_10065/m.24006 type:complete len:333 (+) Transcript_10065:963-1961(+)